MRRIIDSPHRNIVTLTHLVIYLVWSGTGGLNVHMAVRLGYVAGHSTRLL